MAKTNDTKKKKLLTITPPRFETRVFKIIGTAPYVQHKFSQKALEIMKRTQEEGSTAKKGKKREPKDFMAVYEAAKYVTPQGWHGIPAHAFRNACVSACKICGFQMTKAKLSIFIEADGYDEASGTPLVRITKGKPHYFEMTARNDNGSCDIRARPMWNEGWQAMVRIRYDLDQFTLVDVSNLLMRVGQQVGVGEGRPDSKASCGLGWGLFILEG